MAAGRSAGTAAGSRLRRLPPAAAPIAALVAGIVLAVAVVTALGRGDTAPMPDAPRADAEQVPAAAAAEPDGAPKPEPEPQAVVAWLRAAADAPLTGVTAAGDTVVATAEDQIVALDPDSGRLAGSTPSTMAR
ncbi:hypothetical protein BH23ACT10_BH23ACT10_39490 [soil metagenome]